MEDVKKVLVVVDMQNDFIDGSLGTPEAQAIVPNVVKKIMDADKNTLILFTKDTHDENYLNTQEGRKLPVEHCIYESEKTNNGWCINKAVRSAWLSKEGALIIDDYPMVNKNNTIIKITFGSLWLAKIINEVLSIADNGEELEIELVGLCTDICVISNAMILKATFPEAKISVDASCCAGVTPESHENALKAMEMCQIEIINR